MPTGWDEAKMDRQRIEECLERVQAYRASGQKAKAWCQANGVELRSLVSWVAHARRWRARLDGVVAAPRPNGFVAARVALPGAEQGAVRIDLMAGSRSVQLHWPLASTKELAALLRELCA
jgi:hypothetical protein